MNVRLLKFDDLPDLLRLYTFLHPQDRAIEASSSDAQSLWRRILQNPDCVYLGAEVDGRIVSSCTITIIPNLTRELRPYALIENVVTDPSHRTRGYGTGVLKAALRVAWERNCYKVMLETGRSEEKTLRFYESAGFKKGVKTAFIAYPEK